MTFKPMVITLGDAAGIGPEIIVKAFRDAPEQLQGCVVVGDLAVMQRAALLVAQCEYHAPHMQIQLVRDLHEAAQVNAPHTIPVLQVTQPLTTDQLPVWGKSALLLASWRPTAWCGLPMRPCVARYLLW